MESVRIRNLRSIKDSTDIHLKPITLVVGSNSSGKSTFLRLFPLLRQSRDTRTTSPLLWNGDYVDFGSFEESIRRNADSDSIDLTFKFEKDISNDPRYRNYLSRRLKLPSHYEFSIKARITQDKTNRVPSIDSFVMNICGQTVNIEVNKRDGLDRLEVNSRKIEYSDRYTYERESSFLPRVDYQEREKQSARGNIYFPTQSSSKLVDILRSKLHSNTSDDTIKGLIGSFTIGDDRRMLRRLKRIGAGLSSWKDLVSSLDAGDEEFRVIRDLYISEQLPNLIEIANVLIDEFSSGVNYITPLRSRTERYYRKQNLAIDELDPEGENIAIYLYNLTDTEKDNFDRWTQDILGVRIKPRSQGGHLYITIDESANTSTDTEYNLVDSGFGFTQVLPIITQLWSLTRKRRGSYRRRQTRPTLCAMEQPELHLHPKLQARIADTLTRTVRESRERQEEAVPLVVETHSQAIVNRIGHLISNGEVDPDDVQVLLFERENPSLSKIKYASYDSDGYLKDWPVGFFSAGYK